MKHFTGKFFLLVCTLLGLAGSVKAQDYKTVKTWDFLKWSDATLKNFADDAASPNPVWYCHEFADDAVTPLRYKNAITTKAEPLKANGIVIAETDGVIFPEGLSGKTADKPTGGDLVIRHNYKEGENGIQVGSSNKTIAINGLKANQKVTITLKSAKTSTDGSGKRGIASVKNMTGTVGSSTYKDGADGFFSYELTVVADGNASFVYSGGIILSSIKVEERDEDPQPPVVDPSKTNIAYLCTATYAAESDPTYIALAAAYNVTKVDIETVSDPKSLLSYDLVVINSSIAGTNAKALALKNIVGKVPMLNFKSFFYNSGRWGWAAGANTANDAESISLTVQEAFKSHAVFNGVTVAEDGTCVLFKEDVTIPTDGKTHLIQGYTAPEEIIANDDVLAKLGEMNTIHEHRQSSGKNTYMLIPFEQTYATSLSDNAIKLIMNTAAYLIATKEADNTVATPVITTEVIEKTVKVTMACATEGASIYYTTDGTEPTAESTAYAAPVIMTSSCTVKAIAIKNGMTNSGVASANVETPKDPVAVPVITSQTNDKLVKVTITCATEGATIYYTTNGTEPSASSSVYSEPFNISKPSTVKAMAVKEGMANSEVAFSDVENPNYTPRTKELLWVDFDQNPVSWRKDGEAQVDIWGKTGGTGTEERAGGFIIEAEKARILLMMTGVVEAVGSDYGPTTEEDRGASNKSIQIGKGSNSGTGSVTTPSTYQGPFDVAVWWCSSSKAKETISVWVKTPEAAEWTSLGSASTTKKTITKSAFSYEGTGNVLVRVGGYSSNQFNIFDFKVFGEDEQVTPPDGIVSESASKTVASRSYYTVSGVQIAEPSKGLNIVKTVYDDGSVETTKVIVK